ncbi:CsbD family protein [Paracandidimonas soli]|uniref:CsbD-like protein n=1 Tax=Paracandidimonas soli TaxID=1917182 RepID=A0A4R3ULJ2_9BURK|nr:CsbD family protein [Paracandidimonas soli]TCU92565.1 CsbD-like protein [Paracandidimonas soli]
MNKDQAKGTIKEVKGGAKEAFGKATEKPSTTVKGKAEKDIGTMQRKFGDAKDAAQKNKL